MQREQIDQKYKWDLTKIYANDEAWEAELAKLRGEFGSIERFKGRLTESSATLEEFFAENENYSRRLYKLYSYAQMRYDENTKDGKTQDMSNRVRSLAIQYREKTSFVKPELLAKSEEEMLRLIDTPKLRGFRKYFDDMLRWKKHTLSAEMENLLAQVSEVSGTAQTAFSMLNNADLTFEDAVDSEGKSHKVSNGTYSLYMQSPDRALRRSAFESLYKSYKGHINTLAALLQGEVKKNVFNAKVRGYASAREAALFENNIPVSVSDNLIAAVNANLDKNHKAMAIRKKMLGLDELHLYDTYVSLAGDIDLSFTYEEARDLILESFAPLGEEYVAVVREGFDSGWIDVYENEGKRSGAYSGGCYDSAPYVLMNYHGTLNHVFTLAHELGHSMHSYLTRKHQPFLYGNYSIFVAEVASTTNEALLNDYMLKNETDASKRKYILSHYIDGFRGTVYRQTMFAEFERDIHAHVESGGSLTADFLCEHYIGLVRKYFGPDVVIDDEIRYEWARIPHFYYNFYVYQYATGFSAAVALSKDILEGRRDAYLEFLRAGSSDYPIAVLRRAGADMESEGPVNNALSVFSKVLDDFEKLV